MDKQLQELIDSTETYEQMRQFFFKGGLQEVVSKLLDNVTYDSETQPLGELLKQLSDIKLFCYIWKDTYMRAYVFDIEDQRIELAKAYQLAKDILTNIELKNAYIENHDEFIRKEYMKKQNDYSSLVKA